MPTAAININQTTFVSSAQPSANFSFYPLMYVGTDPEFQHCISLIHIPFPKLPKSVDSAVLQLSVIVKSGETPATVAVSQLSAPFDVQTVTHNTLPSLIPTAAQFTVSPLDLYFSVSVDLTDIVNAWLSGAAQNNGIALTCEDDNILQFGTDNIVYAPYFPNLTVTYFYAPVKTRRLAAKPASAPTESEGYRLLSANQQRCVLSALITQRPRGCLTMPDVQMSPEYFETYSQKNLPDPDNLFVEEGAIGGNGSFVRPFGDISSAVEAVNPGGTVHIRKGTYPVGEPIEISKPNILLAGEQGARLMYQLPTSSMVLSGAGVIVTGLTFAGILPQNTFLTVLGDGISIRFNTIYSIPGSEGTGIAVKGSRSDVTIDGNTLYNLKFGIYSDADCNAGRIYGNHIYNVSKAGITLRAGFDVSANRWDPAGSAYRSIDILSGNYSAAALADGNNLASVLDYR